MPKLEKLVFHSKKTIRIGAPLVAAQLLQMSMGFVDAIMAGQLNAKALAAIAVGTRTPLLLVRHVLPNTIAPLIVQATYIAASAILIEAILSFLGVGIPPQTPTWGNIMAEGRTVFRIFPHNILYPGIFLALTVLAVNMLGDGLRDTLDPRMSKRL